MERKEQFLFPPSLVEKLISAVDFVLLHSYTVVQLLKLSAKRNHSSTVERK